MDTPLILGLLALLLSGPVPAVIARLPRLRHTPIATLVLWQAVAGGAVLAALGAGLSLSTVPGVPWWVGVFSLGLTLLVLARLLWTGHRVGTRLRRSRAQHRGLVDILARPEAGLHVLEHDAPLAYCLPGLRSSRVVVTQGALQRLSPAELEAVLAHERAHLRARHDLLLEAFTVLHQAFPRAVSSRAALGEVRLLIEAIADRVALRCSGATSLAHALSTLSDAPAAAAVAAEGQDTLVVRVQLLSATRGRPVQVVLVLLAAAGLLVVPTLLVALPWLAAIGLLG